MIVVKFRLCHTTCNFLKTFWPSGHMYKRNISFSNITSLFDAEIQSKVRTESVSCTATAKKKKSNKQYLIYFNSKSCTEFLISTYIFRGNIFGAVDIFVCEPCWLYYSVEMTYLLLDLILSIIMMFNTKGKFLENLHSIKVLSTPTPITKQNN